MPHYRDLGYSTYEAFLSSPYWRRDVWGAYLKDNRTSKYCFICDHTSFQLHHETYAILGKELVDHNYRRLIPLCDRCHHSVHFDEEGEKVPLREEFLKERRLLMRKRYIYKYLKPSTLIYFTRKWLYRLIH